MLQGKVQEVEDVQEVPEVECLNYEFRIKN